MLGARLLNRKNEPSDMPEKLDVKNSGSKRLKRELTPAAARALAEAEERRKKRVSDSAARARENGGRDGPDPVRYGDWEKDGLASDF